MMYFMNRHPGEEFLTTAVTAARIS
ncbi:MAG: hypothetical protein H6Q94_1242, partial [Nitrospirae bacterium]|nr:hypothetical protein [Nitrospirota bacterium]